MVWLINDRHKNLRQRTNCSPLNDSQPPCAPAGDVVGCGIHLPTHRSIQLCLVGKRYSGMYPATHIFSVPSNIQPIESDHLLPCTCKRLLLI